MRPSERRSERGASLVELALILPILALLVFGTIDLARAYRMNIRLEAAAREGAGFLQVRPNEVDCTDPTMDLRGRVAREDPGVSQLDGYSAKAFRKTGGVFVEYQWCGSQASPALADPVDSGETVRVEVEGTFDVLTPLVENLVGGTLQLNGAAEVVVQG